MKRIQIISFIISSFIYCFCFGQLEYNVDALPHNVGGNAEWKRIFKQELQYPSEALQKKEGGKIRINFVIREDSTVTNIRIQESVSPAIDAEAIRIFKLIQWVPAVRDRVSVACNWNITFHFDPDKYGKICKERGFTSFPYLAEVDTSAALVRHPQQLPVYVEGNVALKDFIRKNLEYPRQAQLADLQGKVVLRFVVEPSGLMTNIGVKSSLGGGCDEEAIRVLQLIKWYPGKKDSKLVRVPMVYPFYFVLNEDFKDNSFGEQK
jgi:protein TonB